MDGSIESAAEALLQPEVVEEKDEAPAEPVTEAEDSDELDSESEEEQEEDEDDEIDDSDEDDAVQEEQAYTVKIDGEEKSVSLTELKQGYSGQQFVQKGMQDNAQMRKQTEQVYNALLESRQQVTELYQQLQNGNVTRQPVKPDLELLNTDPIGYVEANARYEHEMGAYQNEMQKNSTSPERPIPCSKYGARSSPQSGNDSTFRNHAGSQRSKQRQGNERSDVIDRQRIRLFAR
jgi:hypothetical protein